MKAMNEVSKEYGTALYMLACEEDKTNSYLEQLDIISNIFKEQKDYEAFLQSPNIPLKKRIESIETVFSNLVDENMVSFLQLLCEKNRFNCYSDAVMTYRELYEVATRILRVKVKSSIELTQSQKKRLTEKLETLHKCKVDIEYIIDPALIGGIVVEADDKVTDGSIRHRLQQVKDVISR